MGSIAVINQKGGSGKTTTAINLAAMLAKRGLRTVLVDMDPQSHCALGLAVPEQQIDLHVGDAMLAPDDRPLDPKRFVWPVNRTLDLIPSATRLAGLEAARGGLADREDREMRLASVLRRLGVAPTGSGNAPAGAGHDWAIIDCPPSIGLLTFNAIMAATEILIPVETGYFALRGASKQVQTIRALCRRFGQAPAYRVLPTMHDESSTLSCEVLGELGRRFADCLIPVTVRYDVRLKEAASMGSPIGEFAPRSHGAADYAALASWISENPAAPLRLTEQEMGEPPEVGEPGVHARTRGVVSIDLFTPTGDHALAPAPAAVATCEAGAGGHDSGSFFRGAGGDGPVSPVSRAAELAARAKRILQKSEDLTRRLSSDPAVAPAMLAASPTQPHGPVHATPAAPPAPLVLVEPLPVAPPVSTPAPRLDLTYGPRHTAQGTLFLYPFTLGPRVCIAGDHNGWSAEATVMKFNPQLGVHEVCLRIPPGRFRYRLVIGGRWVADPFNPVTEPNPFGEADSVLDIPDTVGAGLTPPERLTIVGTPLAIAS